MLKKFAITIVVIIIFIVTLSLIWGGAWSVRNIKQSNDANSNSVKGKPEIAKSISRREENIRVYITSKKIVKTIKLEDYVTGVVAGEMPAEFNIEALKAQAVAARTFAAAHMVLYGGKPYRYANGGDVTDDVRCQVYISKEEKLKLWPAKYGEEYWNKISEAVNETKGEILEYRGELVTDPLYFAVSRGITEDSSEVIGEYRPYLKSVISSGESGNKKYSTNLNISYTVFIHKLEAAFSGLVLTRNNVEGAVKVLSKTNANGVKKIKVGNYIVDGTRFRTVLKLNSTDFTINYNNNSVEINCIGYGHDVGMSQWGANVMAQAGNKYCTILKHYYTGVDILKLYK